MKQFSKEVFESTLQKFEQIGFTINPGIDDSDLIKRGNDVLTYYPNPFEALYITLGDSKGYPEIYFSNNCWHFDLEAIEGNGSYVKILKNISRISKGGLDFQDIKDYCNEDEDDKAWVSFNLNGDKYKWNLKVKRDWTDGDLFDKIQDLCKKYKTNGRLTFFPEGQSFVTSYLTQNEFETVKRDTGLKVEWLKAKGQIY